MKKDLEALVNDYHNYNTEVKELQKKVKELNKNIKTNFKELGISEYVSKDGIKVTISETERVTPNEDKMLQRLKDLGYTDCITTKEIIDVAKLEDAIYTHKIDAAKLSDCNDVKKVVTMRCKYTNTK